MYMEVVWWHFWVLCVASIMSGIIGFYLLGYIGTDSGLCGIFMAVRSVDCEWLG